MPFIAASTRTILGEAEFDNVTPHYHIMEMSATGDGVADDSSAINNAISLISAAGGGILMFPPRVFRFSQITAADNVWLVGMPGAVLRLLDNVTDQNDANAYYPILASGVDNFRIIDLELDGNGANNRPVAPQATWVADIVTLVNCSNTHIRFCHIHDAPDSGVMFSQCAQSSVSFNRIDGCPDAGIYHNDSTGGLSVSNIIQGNTITACAFGGIASKRYASSTQIHDNTIRDCGNGVTVEDFGGGVHPAVLSIKGNRVEHIGYTYTTDPLVAGIGFSIQEADGSIVEGNIVDDCENQCFSFSGVSNCIISGNQVYGRNTGSADNIGLFFTPRNSAGCVDNVISGNVVRGVQAEGVRFFTGTGDHAGNKLINNVIQSDAGHGLRVDNTFLSNEVVGNTFDGSTFDINANIAINTVTGNRWRDNTMVNGNLNGYMDARVAALHSIHGEARITSSTAAPTVGTWAVGDICWNSSPGVGSPRGWMCTASGTPGTWTSMGNL